MLVFAAMPFGVRSEPGGARAVDFDAIYDECIRPVVETAGMEVIRADEETLGGIIHRPMYERLLLAEVVVADLTFANANVFYELGVRHAAKPRSTILIYAKVGHLPFDVAPIRAIPYELDAAGRISDLDRLRGELAARLELARTDELTDSPLFQLLDGYPGISLAHEATEAFRDRAVWVSELTIRAHNVVRSRAPDSVARERLAEIEAEAREVAGYEEQLQLTLLLAYRSIEAWDEMVRLAEGLPRRASQLSTVQEQLALALNRRNREGDRQRAIEILVGVVASHGDSPETLGLLGRCFKDRWQEKVDASDPGAADALDHAIGAYRKGFESDPRDFYPGVNLVTLLLRRGRDVDLAEAQRVAPVVSFAVARKGGLGSRDYWTLATLLELAAVEDREVEGRRALSAMTDCAPDDWMCETTARNLTLVHESVARGDGNRDWVLGIVDALRTGPNGGANE